MEEIKQKLKDLQIELTKSEAVLKEKRSFLNDLLGGSEVYILISIFLIIESES